MNRQEPKSLRIATNCLNASRAMWLRRLGLVFLLVLGVGPWPTGAAAPPAKSEQLDDDLLKDLLPPPSAGEAKPGQRPLATPPEKTTPPKDEAKEPTRGSREPARDEAVRPGDKPRGAPGVESAEKPAPKGASPDDGEDVAIGPQAALRSLKERMRGIEMRLRQGDSAPQTQATQAAIVAELDAILARMGQGKESTGQAASASSAGEQKPQESPRTSSSEGTAEKPGDEKTAGETARPETRPRELEGQAWGELPPLLREQLRNLAPEKFLPGYEAMIEAYYRRLAEKR